MKLIVTIGCVLFAIAGGCKKKEDDVRGVGATSGSAATGSGPTTPPPPPTPTTPEGSGAGSAGSAAGSSAEGSSAAATGDCTLVSTKVVSEIVKVSMKLTEASPTTCNFEGPDGAPGISVQSSDTPVEMFDQGTKGGAPVTGLGDKAAYGAGATDQMARLVVIKGNWGVTVSAVHMGNNKADMKGIAKQVATEILVNR